MDAAVRDPQALAVGRTDYRPGVGGASGKVAQQLIGMGAFRTLPNARGERQEGLDRGCPSHGNSS